MMPIGTIIAWTSSTIPDGWAVCNGGNGTPDLRDKFVYGASGDSVLRNTGGTTTHVHPMQGTNSEGSHNHGGTATNAKVGGLSDTMDSTAGQNTYSASTGHTHGGGITIASAGSHSHTISGNTSAASNLPPHIKRIFIKRIS